MKVQTTSCPLPDGRKRTRAELPVKDRKRYVLSSIPQIGEKLAANLLERFKTISAIANASMEDLQRVHKIGVKKAELIHQTFHQ